MTHLLVATCPGYERPLGELVAGLVAGRFSPLVISDRWNDVRAFEYSALLWAARCLPERDRALLLHDTCTLQNAEELRGALGRDPGGECDIFSPTDTLQFNIAIYSVRFLRSVVDKLERLRGCEKGSAIGMEGRLRKETEAFVFEKYNEGGRLTGGHPWSDVTRMQYRLAGWGVDKWFAPRKGSWHPNKP